MLLLAESCLRYSLVKGKVLRAWHTARSREGSAIVDIICIRLTPRPM